jgi:hypothetical protein
MANGDRVFALQSHGNDYFAGQLTDGHQIVMGLLAPRIVLYMFDAEGALVERQARDWEHAAPKLGESDIWRLGNAEFKQRLAEQTERWQQEIGFAPGTIRIQWFFDDELNVGIELLPESLRDMSWCETDAQRQEMRREVEEWQEQGHFVFCWAKDYLISAEGNVLLNEMKL